MHSNSTISISLVDSFPSYYSPRDHLIPGVSDLAIAVYSPTVVYWVASLFFHALDTWGSLWPRLNQYRLHDPDEEKKNLVSRQRVLTLVITYQVIQCFCGWLLLEPMDEQWGLSGHLEQMQAFVPSVFRIFAICVGANQAEEIMSRWGSNIIYILYWYILPNARFLSAM